MLFGKSRSWQLKDLPTTSVIGCDPTVLFLIAQILSDYEINLMGGTRLFVSAEVINVLSDNSLSEFPSWGGALRQKLTSSMLTHTRAHSQTHTLYTHHTYMLAHTHTPNTLFL